MPGITMKTQEQLTRIIADHATYDELSKTVTDILGPAPHMSMANGNYVSVSYTHLDVYKRQIMSCATRITMITPMQVR